MTNTVNKTNKEKRDALREKVKEVLFKDLTTANIALRDLDLTAEKTIKGDTIIKNSEGRIIATIEQEHNLD